MTPLRLLAIGIIFTIAATAWVVLAGVTDVRTHDSGTALGGRVEGLWGEPQQQDAPRFSARGGAGSSAPLAIAGSRIEARFDLDQRRKGLLWYATYAVDFDATYRLVNPHDTPAEATMEFRFPAPDGIYDGFRVIVDGKPAAIEYVDGLAKARFTLPAGAPATVETGYRTQGLDRWGYTPSPEGVSVVDDFTLTMETDFADVDYPDDGVSPTTAVAGDGQATLTWEYESLVTGRPIGLVMPKPANPGPLVTRISLFAPVSLLFYFAALVLLTATNELRFHPVNYGFLAAAFFAFHLLLAYLADHIDINAAFATASVASLALCVGYLTLVLGWSRAVREIGVSQLLFLVLFSYSFFFEGFTGLAVTIGSVLTLAYFMVKTAGVDWERVFDRPKREFSPIPPAPEPVVPSALP